MVDRPHSTTSAGGCSAPPPTARSRRTNGTAIVSDSVPDVYDANYLSVESPSAGAADLAAEAETALEASHHCRVIVEDGAQAWPRTSPGSGSTVSTHLVLAHTAQPDRRVDTGAIREVGLDELMPLRTESRHAGAVG